MNLHRHLVHMVRSVAHISLCDEVGERVRLDLPRDGSDKAHVHCVPNHLLPRLQRPFEPVPVRKALEAAPLEQAQLPVILPVSSVGLSEAHAPVQRVRRLRANAARAHLRVNRFVGGCAMLPPALAWRRGVTDSDVSL